MNAPIKKGNAQEILREGVGANLIMLWGKESAAHKRRDFSEMVVASPMDSQTFCLSFLSSSYLGLKGLKWEVGSSS